MTAQPWTRTAASPLTVETHECHVPAPGTHGAASTPGTRGYATGREDYLVRLRRIEGQVRTGAHGLGLCAVAAAIALVGALWFGVPAGTLAFVGIALICPLMMMLMMGGMMGGMHGNGTGTQSHDDTDHSNERDEHSSDR